MVNKTQLDIFTNWILEAINKLDIYTKDMSMENFLADHKTIDACMMQLQHIWETIIQIKKYYPEVKFQDEVKIMWLRHFISHEYIKIDPEIAYLAIKNRLHILKEEISKL